jgi:hypothetical protein
VVLCKELIFYNLWWGLAYYLHPNTGRFLFKFKQWWSTISLISTNFVEPTLASDY